MRTHLALPLLPLLLTSTALLAEDDALGEQRWFHDVRVTLSSMPLQYRQTLEDKSAGTTQEDEDRFDSGSRVSVDYQATVKRTSAFGFTFGGGLDLLASERKNNGNKDELAGVGLHVTGGVAWQPAHFFVLEGTLLGGGGGAAEAYTPAGGPKNESDDGSYAIFSAMVRGVFIIGPGLELFAQGGYVALNTRTDFDADASASSGQMTNEYRVRGGTFGLGAGWRF